MWGVYRMLCWVQAFPTRKYLKIQVRIVGVSTGFAFEVCRFNVFTLNFVGALTFPEPPSVTLLDQKSIRKQHLRHLWCVLWHAVLWEPCRDSSLINSSVGIEGSQAHRMKPHVLLLLTVYGREDINTDFSCLLNGRFGFMFVSQSWARSLFLLFYYYFYCVWMIWSMAHMWRLEDHFVESFIFFHPVLFQRWSFESQSFMPRTWRAELSWHPQCHFCWEGRNLDSKYVFARSYLRGSIAWSQTSFFFLLSTSR